MSLYLGTTPIANDGSHNTANIDLSNLSNTGEAHFANPALTNSPYTTNRILEIPQDIKLELNNGTLTLKAGSKVYVPNGKNADGSLKFNVYIVPSDLITGATQLVSEKRFIALLNDNIQIGVWSIFRSGNTVPSTGYFYHTSENRMYMDGEVANLSLPLMLGDYVQNSGFSSIDQVFNGFGYMGSTVFALPGVKVQGAFGVNEDGTYRLKTFETDHILTASYGSDINGIYTFGFDIFENGTYSYFGANANEIKTGEKQPSGSDFIWWNPIKGENHYVNSSGIAEDSLLCSSQLGRINISRGKIVSMTRNPTDSIVTSNALNFSQAGKSYLSGLGMPSNRYIDLTLGASNSTYTAPANGTVLCVKRAKDVGQSLGLARLSSDIFFDFAWNSVANTNIFLNMDIRKGEEFTVYYTASGTEVQILRFYYAEGEE